MKTRGFTLLEVLVAISVLGLGLTVILGSQTGMFASEAHSENLTHATFLARCKMSETELDLMKEGYPLLDQTDAGKCCEDDTSKFTCIWKVEQIELPEPGSFVPPEGEGDLDAGTPPPASIDPMSGDLGALGAVNSLQNPSGLESGDPLESLATLGNEQGAAGIGSMVMSLVYPDLKPMLEASIRKITVTVKWPEGSSEKDLSVIQYVTDPQEGGLLQASEDEASESGSDVGSDNPLDALGGEP